MKVLHVEYLLVLPARMFHDELEFEDVLEPGGTLSKIINDPLESWRKKAHYSLKLQLG